MPKIRKDNKGRNLRPGETQRSDGSYMFVYKLGKKKKYIYDSDLAALRVKEKQLTKDADDGIRTQEAMKITLNDMFKVLMDTKLQLKASTRATHWKTSIIWFILHLNWQSMMTTSGRIPVKAFIVP